MCICLGKLAPQKFSKIPLAFCRQVLLQYKHDVSRKAGVAAMRGMFFALSDGSDPVTYAYNENDERNDIERVC